MLLDACGEDEVKAFWVLSGLVDGYDMNEMWKRGMKQLDFCFYALEKMMERFLPELREFFEREGIKLGMFASRWFLTVFCSEDVVTSEVRKKVWDIFMMEKWGVVFATSVSILTLVEGDCLKSDFEGCLKLFSNVKKALNNRPDEELVWEWLEKSVGDFLITEEQLNDIRAEFFLESSTESAPT